ncbi:SGNH/GDSL hydrolase family protein [Ectobacillus funiculus]|uniref:SGNH/GDSL hydrolase family protein n=1 Tax=Ectobacillus funiculus TaxID=137993 RepID=UPI00101B7D34|nr:SGNH/GDSL hydrolase family protein [Ectobacillus funiculus]
MRPIMIKVLLAVMAVSLGLFLYGFIVGANDVLNPKASSMPKAGEEATKVKKNDKNLQLVSLGDSLTRGVGDKEAIGYIGRVRNHLESEYQQKTSLANLAVSGAKMPDLLKQLADKGVQYSIKQADVIVFTIGGNDLFPGWEALGNLDLTKYRPDEATFQANAKNIIELIRKVNPDCPIFWIGLYNPFEDVPELSGSSAVVVNWNASLERTALEFSNVHIIPVFDLFHSRGKELLYSDHFHPNEKGYALVANRLLQDLVSQLGIDKKEVTD